MRSIRARSSRLLASTALISSMTASCSPTTPEYASWTTLRDGPSGPSSDDRRPIAVRSTPRAQLPRALATKSAVPWISAGLVVDLATGATVFARNADVSLEPASNEKLGVTYAALTELGPTYRFRTEVLGEGVRRGDVWDGNVVLKGFGDPTLSSRRLGLLA